MSLAERITGFLAQSGGGGTLVSTLLHLRGSAVDEDKLSSEEINEFETIFRFAPSEATQEKVTRRLVSLRNARERVFGAENLRRRASRRLSRAKDLAEKLGFKTYTSTSSRARTRRKHI